MTGIPLIIVFLLAIVAMIFMISKLKIHPFLSIMTVALVFGLIGGIPLVDVMNGDTTTAGIVAPMLPALGLETSVQIALAVMAIAAGAMTVSHANDSYFWVVINFGGMTADQGYRTQTVVTLIMGVVSIIFIWVLSLILR